MSEEAKPKVVTLYGQEIIPPGVPNPHIVKILTESLDRAQQGDIIGLALAYQVADKSYESRMAGENSNGLIGMLERLKNRLL